MSIPPGTVSLPSIDATIDDLLRRIADLEAAAADGIYKIKLFADSETVDTEAPFFFDIDRDLNEARLKLAVAYVSSPSSSGPVEIQVRNVTLSADMLNTPLTIDEGQSRSGEPDISFDDAVASEGDEIRVDIENAGTNAAGLVLTLVFA